MKTSTAAAIVARVAEFLERHPAAAWGPAAPVVHQGRMERAAQAARLCAAILARREGRQIRAGAADVELLNGVGWYEGHSDAEIRATRALARWIAMMTREGEGEK